ncbi:WD40 repeat-like protein [Rhizopogon salebrosus TDB-379]|nr:WD40 repeat-like protein [Rhizopogon salebrosus TDB-379]
MKDRTQLIELAHQNPVRLEGHERDVTAIATFPDGVRIATGSGDKTIRIWRLEDDRTEEVGAGEDSRGTFTLDGSPDGGVLASGSYERRVILWETTSWQGKDDPVSCGAHVTCVQFSPTGWLGIATLEDIQIWNLDRRQCPMATPTSRTGGTCRSPGLVMASISSAGDKFDPVIRSCDTSTWKQAGEPQTGHDNDITLNPAGTLLVSISDNHSLLVAPHHGHSARAVRALRFGALCCSFGGSIFYLQ